MRQRFIGRIQRYLMLSLLPVLSACVNLVVPTTLSLPQSASSTPATRQYHEQIEMSGRLSVQYEQKDEPQAIHIKFNWSQTPQQIELTLASPTGQTLAVVAVNQQGAELKQANKAPRFAGDVNQLLLDTVGWPLPIANLRDWLQGFINTEHRPALSSDSAPSDTYFIIEGWMLEYTAWQHEEAENNVQRPKRLKLTRQTEQAGLVTLRIVIDQWKPNNEVNP